ncbi:MAG: hypothetical protein V1921_05095 [Candidatus Altiarchaeota archaeon]
MADQSRGPQKEKKKVTGESQQSEREIKEIEPKRPGWWSRFRERGELKKSLPTKTALTTSKGEMVINLRKEVLSRFPLKSSKVVELADEVFGQPEEDAKGISSRDHALLSLVRMDKSLPTVYQDRFRQAAALLIIDGIRDITDIKDKNLTLSKPHAILDALRSKGNELVTSKSDRQGIDARVKFFTTSDGALKLLKDVRDAVKGELSVGHTVDDEKVLKLVKGYDISRDFRKTTPLP